MLCSCGINNHQTESRSQSRQVLIRGREVTQVRSSHKATVEAWGWGCQRGTGAHGVKWSYNLVYVGSSKDRWWIHNRMTHSSSKGSMTWDTHRTHTLVQSPDLASRCLFVTLWWFYPEHLWSHFLSQSHQHAHTHTHTGCHRTNCHQRTHTHTHTYIWTNTLLGSPCVCIQAYLV